MKRLKTYRLFESVDTDELLSIVKDMLSELDFNDFSHNAVIRRQDGREFIRVAVYKPAIVNRHTLDIIDDLDKVNQLIANSFTWNDVKGVMYPIIDFLSEEGFEWFKDRGTSHTENVPRVVSRGSYLNNQYNTKIEMWFLKI
jgi:hypothetical protein